MQRHGHHLNATHDTIDELTPAHIRIYFNNYASVNAASLLKQRYIQTKAVCSALRTLYTKHTVDIEQSQALLHTTQWQLSYGWTSAICTQYTPPPGASSTFTLPTIIQHSLSPLLTQWQDEHLHASHLHYCIQIGTALSPLQQHRVSWYADGILLLQYIVIKSHASPRCALRCRHVMTGQATLLYSAQPPLFVHFHAVYRVKEETHHHRLFTTKFYCISSNLSRAATLAWGDLWS